MRCNMFRLVCHWLLIRVTPTPIVTLPLTPFNDILSRYPIRTLSPIADIYSSCHLCNFKSLGLGIILLLDDFTLHTSLYFRFVYWLDWMTAGSFLRAQGQAFLL